VSPPTSSTRAASLAGYAGFVLIGWNAVLVPSLIRSVEHTFGVTDAAVGVFFFVSALVYAAGSFGGGLLTERVGRRIVLAVAAALLSLGLAGESAAPAWWLFLLATPLVNWGAGAIDGGINGMFLDLYREARGGALNLLHTFFSVGAFVGPFVVGVLVSGGINWRAVILGTGAVSLLVAFWLLGLSLPSGRHRAEHSAGIQQTASERSLLPFLGLAAGICFYVAGEIGISNWLVKFLNNQPVTLATGVLSGFWAGLALGRLLSRWIAEKVDYVVFTVGCFLLASATLILALISPWFPLEAFFFVLAGLFSGPVYPMIMSIGGNIYPHRLARLSGSLSAAAVVGGLTYPPIMGFMAASTGIGAGMLGAALLGIPGALAVLFAGVASRRERSQGQALIGTVSDLRT
jgi:fucose permease